MLGGLSFLSGFINISQTKFQFPPPSLLFQHIRFLPAIFSLAPIKTMNTRRMRKGVSRLLKRFSSFLLFIALVFSLLACNNATNESMQDHAIPDTTTNPLPLRNYGRWWNTREDLTSDETVDDNISSTKTNVPSDRYPHTRAIIIQEAKFKAVPYNQADQEENVQPDEKDINKQGQQATGRQDNFRDLPNLRKDVREKIRQRISQGEWLPNIRNRRDTTQQPITDQYPPANENRTQQPGEKTTQPTDKNAQREEKAGTPAPPDRNKAQETRISEFAQRVIDLTNEHRRANGLKPLTHDPELSRVAQQKSVDMHQNNYFSHTSPTYGSPFDMMRDFGIEYKTAGENIAQGQRTPEAVVEAWMNSAGHRANILNPNFTHIGVGVEQEEYHWTQMFIGK